MLKSEVITARRNPLVREWIDIRDDRHSAMMFLEGPRIVQDLLSSGYSIEVLIYTSSKKTDPLIAKAAAKSKRQFEVSNDVFDLVSDVEQPQGLLAIASKPKWSWEQLIGKAQSPVVILDAIQDPGNVATIARTADAAGAAGIVTTKGTASFFSPKAIRGATGSNLRLPILEHFPAAQIAANLKPSGYELWGTTGKGGTSYSEIDSKNPIAIVFGQEGGGITEAWKDHIAQWVTIPMKSPVESLNVASAAAVLLYALATKKAALQ